MTKPDDARGDRRGRVAIAGATGFVGSALCRALAGEWDVIGLTRSPVAPSPAATDDAPPVDWRRCDLFEVREVAAALRGCDRALYLVHSMLPSSRLTQADFADLDLLMADTFRRGAERAGIRQIVFLGGLVPPDGDLSRHLASRLEVEDVLAAGPIPLTVIRAGLIVGPEGSSFRLMENLVRRLPAMILPRWTRSRTQPVALRDVIRAFRVVLAEPVRFEGRFDIGGPDRMTYKEMMARTASVMGRRIRMLDVRAFSPRLSIAWVCLFGGAPRALVGPLVHSLRHDMLAAPNPLQEALAPELAGFEDSVRDAIVESRPRSHRTRPARRRTRTARSPNQVRSVQRFRLPEGRSARWVAREYVRWATRFLRPFVRVGGRPGGRFTFGFGVRRLPLLELSLDRAASGRDRQVFRISGGWLARRTRPDGRMEFRVTPGGESVLIAIHDYVPALPWYVYHVSQARAHLFVMRAFGRHLSRLADRRERPAVSGRRPSAESDAGG